jgi:uncharacterized LabA/DUF88 family protein
MKERYENVDQKVAVLIDANNIELNLQRLTANEKTIIDFDKCIPRLLNKRRLNRLIYFKEGRKLPDALKNSLHEKFCGTVRCCHKSADGFLIVAAWQLSKKVDTVIIMSGDADYIPVVKQLQSEGVRVEVAAVYGSIANALINVADYYHYVTEEDSRILH